MFICGFPMRSLILSIAAFISLLAWRTGGLPAQDVSRPPAASSASSRDQLYRAANELLQSGRFVQATAAYKAIIARWPGFYQAYSLLGVAYTQMGKLEQATACFLKAVELQPGSAEARNNLGANYLALKKFSQAAAEFRQVIALSPESVSAWYNLGASELQAGRDENSVAAFERAAQLAPGDLQVRIGLAEARFKAGHPRQALAAIQQAKGIGGNDAGMLLTLGLLLERNGLSDEAVPYFQDALRLSPSTSERMMTLAGSSIDEGDYKTALGLLGALQGRMDNSAAWHGMLGYSHFKLDHIELAMEHLQKAIRLDPTNEDYYLDLGELLGENNALLANVAVFESAIEVLPNSIKIRLGLAVAHLLTGNLERTEQEIGRVLSLQSKSEVAYKVLLEAFEKSMDWARMQATARQLRQLNKTNSVGWYYGALSEYEIALRSKSSFASALALIQKASALDSRDWRTHFLLGKILVAEGRHREAVSALQRAIQLNRDHPQPYYVLARALQQLARKQEALEAMNAFRSAKSRMESRQFRRLLVDIR